MEQPQLKEATIKTVSEPSHKIEYRKGYKFSVSWIPCTEFGVYKVGTRWFVSEMKTGLKLPANLGSGTRTRKKAVQECINLLSKYSNDYLKYTICKCNTTKFKIMMKSLKLREDGKPESEDSDSFLEFKDFEDDQQIKILAISIEKGMRLPTEEEKEQCQPPEGSRFLSLSEGEWKNLTDHKWSDCLIITVPEDWNILPEINNCIFCNKEITYKFEAWHIFTCKNCKIYTEINKQYTKKEAIRIFNKYNEPRNS